MLSTECQNKKKMTKLLFQPRSYQVTIVNFLTQQNGIVYLPTGAGKTYIAIIVMKRLSKGFDKSIANGGKRGIFMCNTIELAKQQAIEIKKITSFKVGLYIGSKNVDSWSKLKWKQEVEEHQVLVGTAQIFVDMVSQNILKISDLGVVVIDECHNAVKSHPMREFMRFFDFSNQDELPRVIGLSGVLLKGNKIDGIKQQLCNLETIMRGNIIFVDSMEAYNIVKKSSTLPQEAIVTYDATKYESELEKIIIDIVKDSCKIVENWNVGQVRATKNLGASREPTRKSLIKNLMLDFLHKLDDLGIYAASFSIISVLIEFEIKKRQSETIPMRNMFRYIITICEQILHMLVTNMKKFVRHNEETHHTIEVLLNFSTPKLRALFTHLKKTFQNKDPLDITCLVFVQRRQTAKCLYNVLLKYFELTPELRNVLKPNFLVGNCNTGPSTQPSVNDILNRQWCKEGLKKFLSGECNILVCSNVLEEGIDIQSCNYVFIFDPIVNFCSYIQIKGRARSKKAVFNIFESKKDYIKLLTKIILYKQIHEKLETYLLTRNIDNLNDFGMEKHYLDLFEPYEIPSGARLLASGVLSLIHRYCQTLPSDIYGNMGPLFGKYSSSLEGCRVSLKLPMQSSIKQTFVSDLMPSIKAAKISVSFKVCKKLYENGELNNMLLPISRSEYVACFAGDLFKKWEKYNNKDSKTCFSKNEKSFNRMCPKELFNSLPIVGQCSYAYEITFSHSFEENAYNIHVGNMLKDNSSTYAILLNKKLPPLAAMPLFMNQGKFNVKIVSKPIECSITNNEDIELLLNFHLMLFRDILECWKNFLVLDRRNKQNSYLIVPIKNSEIDWDVVKKFQELPKYQKYTVEQRKTKVYRPEDYLGKVVNKWYSDSKCERYFVTKILSQLTPLSELNEDEDTYKDFMEMKYGNKINHIVNTRQFLIEVKQFTSRRNFFVNAVGKNSTIAKKNRNIILIPELCHNFQYPAVLWLKALFLPSILHRMYFMLHAEELRQRINSFLELKFDDANYEPKPLIVDISLRRAVDIDGNAIEEHNVPNKQNRPPPPIEYEISDCNLTDTKQWKKYLEPENYFGKINTIYPVEINYIHKFTSAFVEDDVVSNEERLLNSSQLEMRTRSGTLLNEQLENRNVLPIADAPIEEKIALKMIENSFRKSFETAEQHDFLAAITTASSNDVFDMERFELLGDSFLKFSISLYLVEKFPNWHEGFLTEIKSKLVSNRNLLYCMLDMDIPERVSVSLLNPDSDWLPPLVSLPSNILDIIGKGEHSMSAVDLYSINLSEDEIKSGRCSEENMEDIIKSIKLNSDNSIGPLNIENECAYLLYKEGIRDKNISDTLEALLGVCVKNYGIYKAFEMLAFFEICTPFKNKPLSSLLDIKMGSNLRANILPCDVDAFLINYKYLEENLCYKFKDRAYLLQALTHPSFPTNRITGCYQELEFIGDAILDFLISSYIFERHQNMTPGMLTDLRSAIVNNITLGCVCVRHRFHLYLLYENSFLSDSIRIFHDHQELNNFEINDQVYILMEEDQYTETTTYNMSMNVNVPKALGDIVEALIGAVFLDSRNMLTTWKVVYHLLHRELHNFSLRVPIDPVRQLIEHKTASPTFSKGIHENDVSMITCTFTCLNEKKEVNGFGENVKQAKKAAAKYALQYLAKST